MGAVLGRIVNDYEGLMEVCRQRAAELEISRLGIDELSGLPTGFAGKILGHRQAKRLGPKTLGPLMQVLGLKLLVIEDESTTARTLARREPVTNCQQRFNNVSRLTPKLLPPPSKKVSPPILRVVPQIKRRGVTKYGC
jgi:hypothetical protein